MSGNWFFNRHFVFSNVDLIRFFFVFFDDSQWRKDFDMNIQSRVESDFSVRQRRAVQIQVKISIKLKLFINSDCAVDVSAITTSWQYFWPNRIGRDWKSTRKRFLFDLQVTMSCEEKLVSMLVDLRRRRPPGGGGDITAHRFILGNRNCKLSSRRNCWVDRVWKWNVQRWPSDEEFLLKPEVACKSFRPCLLRPAKETRQIF